MMSKSDAEVIEAAFESMVGVLYTMEALTLKKDIKRIRRLAAMMIKFNEELKAELMASEVKTVEKPLINGLV